MLVGLSMKAWRITLIVSLAAALTPGAAYAQRACGSGIAPTTCLPADNLWPSAGGEFTWLAPATTTAARNVIFGVTTSWVYRPIALTVGSTAPEGATVYPVEHAIGAHLLATIGLSSRLNFDVAAPMTLYQSGAGVGFLTGSDAVLPRSASGDLRFGPSVSLIRGRAFNLAARVQVVAPTGSTDAFATFGSVTVAPGISAAYRYRAVQLGADIGARLRKSVEFADAVIGHQMTLGVGATIDLVPNALLTMGLEVFGLFGLEQQYTLGADATGRDDTGGPLIPAEWLATFSTARALEGKLRMRVGMGGALPTGTGSDVTAPALRTVASVSFTP